MKKEYSAILISTLIGSTGAIALSIHVSLIQYFHPPITNINPTLNQILGFIIKFLTVAGAMFISILSKKYWIKLHLFWRIILFAVFVMALTEQLLRSLIIELAIGVGSADTMIKTIANYVSFLTLSLFIWVFMETIYNDKKFLILRSTLFAILATAAIFFIKKETNHVFSSFLEFAPQSGITNPDRPPYGANIITPAYITFLEPSIASFVLFYLIKDELHTLNTLKKGIFIGAILIIIHGGLYSLAQIFYSEGNVLYRILYHGQFLWEYIALGILTSCSFTLMRVFNCAIASPADRLRTKAGG